MCILDRCKDDTKRYRANICLQKVSQGSIGKRNLPGKQAGFRKDIKVKIRKFILHLDLKTAFNTVIREKLWGYVEQLGIKEFKGKFTDVFWTTKGLRQACVLSPILFCIYIAVLEEEFRKRKIGGVKKGNTRVWSLAYAGDIVLMASNRKALLDMLGTTRIFLDF
ncbi:hypothetical protein TSAR_000224 [Trichomalopsis sarcophagae]|uniref:Reverse transcriptase domain-containing protein n=1 Tax=Trichomalopsis sarcophagae TaxID=543379 RepID=A0A232EX75_9HYME|nr:hypothetical protein TSAR_000224 [Trichomalopsis sarcophagae]